ncbi:MAG: 3'(2'),5'-bisphosphate nucleotidase [Micavibrio sp.]|nr:3'(2'),5'-bisphosphate nucleotidase [Micavibrio sp.]
MTKDELAQLTQKIIPAALRAGEVIEEQVKKGIKVLRKDDGSPVTAADQLAENEIIAMLESLDLGFPIVGEELVADGNAPIFKGAATYWLVDALDGTKEFIKGTGEYTVNIALIIDKAPVLGVVYAPAQDKLYYGYADKAYKRDGAKSAIESIKARKTPEKGLTIATSRSHGSTTKVDTLLEGHKVETVINSGSSLKFCLIAEGLADLYPRYGRTCEWDTAAAHAILNAAGGSVVRADNGEVLAYGKITERFYNPEFLALNKNLKF